MRRERIIKAVNSLREALHAAQIRELLRVARTGQQADTVNRTQRILLAYNEFTRHYQQFGDEEKDLMTFFGLTPLLDISFWSGLIDGEQAVNRKLISDVDVGAYNVIFVMPKLRELLTRETDKGELIIADSQGTEREIKRVRRADRGEGAVADRPADHHQRDPLHGRALFLAFGLAYRCGG